MVIGSDHGHPKPVNVRPVHAVEWRELRELRLRALKTDPQAFGSTFAEESADPDYKWIEWAKASEEGERTCTFVALGRRGWKGMVLARLLDDGDAGLFAMWVEPRDRGKGIAVALVHAIVLWAQERRVAGISLSVAEDNTAATALFGSKGFSATGELRPLPSRPEVNALKMRRETLADG
jgi:ribosomal protein S18 acetylase RimI-like enzyme